VPPPIALFIVILFQRFYNLATASVVVVAGFFSLGSFSMIPLNIKLALEDKVFGWVASSNHQSDFLHFGSLRTSILPLEYDS
jgi:hypothetical protein